MGSDLSREPMLDLFIFETSQLVEELEQIILRTEKTGSFEAEDINEMFRIMHTIKGAASMMLFESISSLAHSVEDLFYLIREEKPQKIDYSGISDAVLAAVDYIKKEVLKLQSAQPSDGDSMDVTLRIKELLESIKSDNQLTSDTKRSGAKKDRFYIGPCRDNCQTLPVYNVTVFFEDEGGMENLRAFSLLNSVKDAGQVIKTLPEEILSDEMCAEKIKSDGFTFLISSHKDAEVLKKYIMASELIREVEISPEDGEQVQKKPAVIDLDSSLVSEISGKPQVKEGEKDPHHVIKQNVINVNVLKLDMLMDLVGELVISEAMVTRNPDLQGLQLDNFSKAARQLRKITNELQDVVMSIRMVPLASTFQKMKRIVRDMCKKLGKEVELELIGEETEVDKNIIEHLSDPLMHLIRNSIDHGIEDSEIRRLNGKNEVGKLTLEARNAGGDVIILVKDDGKGLDKEKILKKARENNLITKPENEMTDKEIYSLIFLPGFSTKESVSEFSGRGVGMDVVTTNIEKIGGAVHIDSKQGEGTVISIKIPLTLAIIDGMMIKAGENIFTIPTVSIRESFRPGESEVFDDPDGLSMILIRGQCYPVIRLGDEFSLNAYERDYHKGIIIMIENEERGLCLMADSLLGEQQVVVKPLPSYIKKVKGIAGCTILGDGNISLILDIANLLSRS